MQVLVLGLFMFLSAVSPGLCVVFDPGGKLGDLGRKVGIACEEREEIEGGIISG